MYRALYRKWRPQRFEDVVGQRAIVAALKNQVAAERVGHAYLFTGVRGTGKTTCAKIFAKAVNCLHPHNGDPCGECDACRGIDNGSILDVVEMDAASNNGVDDIRDLRDETAYTPSACRYKVYIIDEVHMLSTAAFNALLKTLEEPPAHVIFILATTEIQKVPATILSRCQRYDFTRILPEDIAGRVAQIAAAEKLELSAAGADLIARLADGALRDALSILDTCAGVTAKIDEEVVRRMAGVTDRSYLFRISDAVAARDGVTALAELAALRQQSVDVKRLSEELIGHYRSLMLAALPGGRALLSGVSPEEEQLYLDKAQQIGQGEAIRAIRALGSALEKMTRGNDQRIELELAVFSLTEPVQTAAPTPAAQPMQGAVTAAQERPSVQPFARAPARPVATAAEVRPFAANTAQAQAEAAQPTEQKSTAQNVQAVVSTDSAVQTENRSAEENTAAAKVAETLSEAFPLPAQTAEPASKAEDFSAPPPKDDLREETTHARTPQQSAERAEETDEIPLPEPPPPPEEAPVWDEFHHSPPAVETRAAAQSPRTAAPADGSQPVRSNAALPWNDSPAPPREPSPRPAAASAQRTPAASSASDAQYAADPTVSKERVVAAEGINPFPAWSQVVKRIQDADPMLYSYLKRSKAYFDGKRVLIDGGNVFRDFIRQNKDSQKRIKEIIAEVAGVSVPIGPYTPQAQRTERRGNAEDTLHSLEKMGLDVVIRDTERTKRKK